MRKRLNNHTGGAPPKRNLRQHIASALDGSHPKLGHTVQYTINFFIVVSVALLSFETVDSINAQYRSSFATAEIIVVLVFLVEYLLRVWSAPNRLRYIFSFWGVVDFVSFAPGLLTLTFVTPSTALRSLRLVRLLKLTRASGAIDTLGKALYRVRHEMVAMILMGAITFYLSAVGIYIFEAEAQPDAFGSIPQSIWWAAVTLTTVGYGDVYPVTVAGRVFTMVVLTLGLGVVAVPTALLSASLVNVIRDRTDQKQTKQPSANSMRYEEDE